MAHPVQGKVVRTPLGRRLRLWLPGFLPVTVWLAGIVVVVILLGRQQQQLSLIEGVVEVRQIGVGPLEDGILIEVLVDRHDEVESGQVLALMDDTQAQADLLAAEVTLRQLRSDLETGRAREQQSAVDRIAERRCFLVNLEEARLSHLDRVVEQERDKVELARIEVRLRQESALVDLGLLDPFTRDQTQLEAEALTTQLREHDKALRESLKRIAETDKRQEAFGLDPENGTDSLLLTALGESIAAQEHVLEQLSEKIARLTLRSPIKGTVSQVDFLPGAAVLAGIPVLYVSDPAGTRVVAYVPEALPVPLEPNAPVSVFCQSNTKEAVPGRVISISSRMEEMPLQLVYPAVVAPLGRPVLIGDLPPGRFVPGQSVLVRP